MIKNNNTPYGVLLFLGLRMNIEELIKQNITFKSHNSDWYRIMCPVCNDYKVRAGFIFNNSGEECTYHCFNNKSCGGSYVPSKTGGNMSKQFRHILDCFNVPEMEYKQLVFDNMMTFKKENDVAVKSDIKYPQSICMPNYFTPLEECDNIDFKIACEEYLQRRKINKNNYKFYVSTTTPFKEWDYRLIIPCFNKSNIIYYIGRDIFDIHKHVYINPTLPGSNILYNYDELFRKTKEPLFILEGFFDGICLNNTNFVACLSSNLTHQQLLLLNQSQRRKIILPDLRGNGFELAEQGYEHGYEIAFPNLVGCKDVNEAVIKFGRLYVLREILSNIYSGDEAKLRINLLKYNL